jgi:hypothetical protein
MRQMLTARTGFLPGLSIEIRLAPGPDNAIEFVTRLDDYG